MATGKGSVEATSEPATVTVRGEAAIRVQPDEALLWITLSALDASPGAALADVEERSRALIGLLDELRVGGADRSTSGVGVHEEVEHGSRGRRSLGHRAIAIMTVRLDDAALAGRLISRAVADLAASVAGPHWYVAPDNPVRLQAAGQAAANARQKAEAYASGADAKLGPLLRLFEPDGMGLSRRGSKFAAIAASGGQGNMPVEAGEHEVIAVIDATFVLEPS